MRLLPILMFTAACGPGQGEPECTPFEASYTQNVEPILEVKCGECHGAEPAFGAPFSLLDGYEDLVAGDEGTRKVDLMLNALLAGTMPEASSEPLTHTELDTLVGWASCGMEHPDPSDGLVANRDVWEAPASPPEGSIAVDLTAVDEVVDVDDIDDYRRFFFSSIVESEQFIRRIEPIIDDSRVLHHITLTREQGFPYLYAWAPGTGAIEFPNGGMRLRPGDRLRVEIHYNNGAGVTDAVDSSGIRLWVGPPEGIEYGMMSPTTWNIWVPANSTGSVTQECTASMDFQIVAGMPHMHEIGDTFDHDVIRSDGTVDNLISLTGWSFEAQYFYDMPMSVSAGDQLRMRCGYDNPTNETVTAGLGTSDEMCFDFMVVTPAAAAAQCANF